MTVAYQCQLPGRRGMTLRLGEHRLSIDHDGMVRVPDDQLAYFRAQPLVWRAVGSGNRKDGDDALRVPLSPVVTPITTVQDVTPVSTVTPAVSDAAGEEEVNPDASASAVELPKRRGRPRRKP